MKATALPLLCLLCSVMEVHSQSITIVPGATDSTSVTISWALEGVTTTVMGYSISYSNTNTECFTDSGTVFVSAGVITHTLTDLEESSEYTITVAAQLTGQGPVEDSITATTLLAAPSGPPTSVTTSQVTPFSITVVWGPLDCIHRNGDITCYLVRYSIQGSGSAPSTLQVCAAMSITISGLSPATPYDIEVAAVNSAGTGVYYNISVPTLLKAPVVSVDSSTATNISLSWTSAGMVVERYVVMWERDTAGECSDEDEGSVTLRLDSLSYIITELEEDSSYTITVTAINAAGSAVHNPVIGMTGKAAPSAPPNSVNTFDVTSSSITLQWGAVDCIHRNGDILYYSVRYGVKGSAEGDRTVNNSSERMYEILGLHSSTTYCIEVAAVNSAGTGVYNDPLLCVTTLMADSSEFPGTIAIFVGGGIAAVLIIAVMIIVVVALCRLRRCLCSGTPNWEPRRSEDVLTNTNEAYELASVEENIYEEAQ